MVKQRMTLAFARAIILGRSLLSVGAIKNVRVTHVSSLIAHKTTLTRNSRSFFMLITFFLIVYLLF